MIHVIAGPADAPPANSEQPWMLPASESCPGATFKFAQDGDSAAITTDRLKDRILSSSAETSPTARLAETGSSGRQCHPRTYEPDVVNGLPHLSLGRPLFRPNPTEGYYGLGQHQSGMFNYRGGTGPARAEQYRRRHSAAPLQQRLRPDVEHGVSN